MLYKLTQFIDQSAEDVSPALWSPTAVQRMKSIVERFPEPASRTIGPVRLGIMGLELRLADGAEQVDLTFPILGEDRDVILQMAATDEGKWLREDPHWSRIVDFCRRWADPDTLLGQHVKLLWFELDVAGETDSYAEGEIPPPGVFVRFEPTTTHDAPLTIWRRLLSEVLVLLTGEAPNDDLVAHLELATRELPDTAFVQYIGLMLSRGGSTVRFVFSNVGDANLPSFLERLGWPGTAENLTQHLAVITKSGDDPVHLGANAVQVDIGPAGVLPRIGLEYLLDRTQQVERGIEEQDFLDHLVNLGLMSSDKHRALNRLPGAFAEPWRDLCLLGHARKVHHIKVVIDETGATEAKAYYGRSLILEKLSQPATIVG